MVIISVSKSKEKAMLKTVSVLLRLLRKAFLVTNRVNVIFETQEREEEYPVITCAAEPRKDKRTQAPLSTMRQPKPTPMSDGHAIRPDSLVEIVIQPT